MSSNRTSHTSQGKEKESLNSPTDFGYQLGEYQRNQHEEDKQFWEGMDQCKRYLKEIQSQIGYIWQAPEKNLHLEIQQQKPYFMSQITLKQKLTSIKDQKQSFSIQRKRIFSNLSNKNDRRSRSSTISTKIIDKCQQKLTELQKLNQNRLHGRYGKTLSLVKLKTPKLQQGNQQQQFMKELPITSKHQQRKAIFKQQNKLRLLQKHIPTIPDDGTIPMLTQLSYNISEDKANKNSMKGIIFKKSKEQLQKFDLSSKVQVYQPYQTIVKNKSKLKIAKQQIKIKCEHRKLKLKINDYVPEIKSQIIVRDWEVFNRTVGMIKNEQVSSGCQLLKKPNQNIPSNLVKAN